MEFFIASNGQKLGPFSIYRITDMLRDKELSGSDLGWTKDQGDWVPLEEIPAFESTIRNMRTAEREEKLGPSITLKDVKAHEAATSPIAIDPVTGKKKLRVPQGVQPFTRFWARMLDYMIVFSIVYLYAETPPMPESVTFSEIWAQQQEWAQSEAGIKLMTMIIIALFSWQMLEGILIWAIGTTPGKFLFGIRVTKANGEQITIGKSMARSWYAFAVGFGLGISCLPYLGMAFGFFRLMSRGKTLWDEHLNLKTHHAPMGPLRILVAIGAFLVLMVALQVFKFS